MNKQELIDKYTAEIAKLRPYCSNRNTSEEQLKDSIYTNIIDDLKELDEPQKPVVPMFVGEYLNYCMVNEWTLGETLTTRKIRLPEYLHKAVDWLNDSMNQNIFAQAWLFGYEVEKNPLYCVKIGKGYFSGWDENKVTYVIDDAPGALAQRVKYETREESEMDAIQIGGTVEEVAEE